MLNAVSRTIAPALHSASLRTYVMVIVATTVLIGGAVLMTAPGLGSAVSRTSITVPDVLIVIIIITGAVTATLARSTMSAVLSLGAVGYGVAMIFLSFGAPDLAMTQFSVETLTVLIYVLVFRHFPSLGQLSPWLVRARDGLIAVAVGLFIGGLLLFVATTETAPRLREYFAEFGPTLGHGRNIVNVILVDFRGFDTLAEITVLATAAIGVRALLQLASTDRPGHEPIGPATSPIFRTAARLLMPLLLLFAVFLLLRGHNEPGGGFVGGLVAAAAFALYAIAFGVQRARQALLVNPLTLLGTGLLIALASGLPASASRAAILDGAVAFRAGGTRNSRPVRRRRVPGRRGSRPDDDLQPGGGGLMELLLAVASAVLYAAGIYLMLRRRLVQLIIGLGLLSNGTNLLIFTAGGLTRARPPVVPEGASVLEPPYADPVPQALVLTAIVIGFGLLAFSLVLAHRVHGIAGSDDVDDVGRDR